MLTNQRVLKIHVDEDAKMGKHKQQTKQQQQQKSSLKYKLEVDNCKEKKKEARPGWSFCISTTLTVARKNWGLSLWAMDAPGNCFQQRGVC